PGRRRAPEHPARSRWRETPHAPRRRRWGGGGRGLRGGSPPVIVVVGLSHKKAPIEVREKLAGARAAVPEVLARLTSSDFIGEAVVLSTCNRVEVYAAARRRGATDAELADAARAALSVLREMGGEGVLPYLVNEVGKPAVLHLFR